MGKRHTEHVMHQLSYGALKPQRLEVHPPAQRGRENKRHAEHVMHQLPTDRPSAHRSGTPPAHDKKCNQLICYASLHLARKHSMVIARG